MFLAVFVIEAVLKLTGLGRNYFREPWNVFDFALVLGSSFFMVLELMFGFKDMRGTAAFRALRIGRILELFRDLRSLRIIYSTFIISLGPLINVGSVMMVLLYIYAVIGMNQFALVKVNPPMHNFRNFQTVWKSMITLLQVATGEDWNDLIAVLSREYSLTNQCIENPTY